MGCFAPGVSFTEYTTVSNLFLSVPRDLLLPYKPDPEVSQSEPGK